ncbi:unnamed protein product [Protopolystoma xenopodis]|uniref:Uncharacterized protein n=1 Tax=Protopolystoma xenopodis TaxID=117903 RepID=A0A3S5AH48_9PLAT|nr:unnamed protein product [Protopolystoma xenopodis]
MLVCRPVPQQNSDTKKIYTFWGKKGRLDQTHIPSGALQVHSLASRAQLELMQSASSGLQRLRLVPLAYAHPFVRSADMKQRNRDTGPGGLKSIRWARGDLGNRKVANLRYFCCSSQHSLCMYRYCVDKAMQCNLRSVTNSRDFGERTRLGY